MAIQGCRAAHNWCSKANLLGVGGGLPDDRRSSVNTFMINPLRENIGPGGCTGPGWTRGAPAHGCYAPQHIFLRRCSKYVLGALFLERFLPKLGPPVRWRPLFMSPARAACPGHGAARRGALSRCARCGPRAVRCRTGTRTCPRAKTRCRGPASTVYRWRGRTACRTHGPYAVLATPLPSAACAAARRAIGTRNGEHDT
jgi:hypothetical protein